jgi:hypothetical protein
LIGQYEEAGYNRNGLRVRIVGKPASRKEIHFPGRKNTPRLFAPREKWFVPLTILIDDPQASRDRYAGAKVDDVLISNRHVGSDRREGSAMAIARGRFDGSFRGCR